MTEERDWIGEQVERRRELDQQRAEWEQQRAAAAEQAERGRKHAELEAYLQRRGREWQDTTGTTPPMDVLARWQEEFMDEQEAEYQRARAERLARAERDSVA